MSNDTPPPMPDFPPAPPAPKKPRNWVVIGTGIAVIAAVIGTGLFVVNSRDDSADMGSASASSTPTDETVTAAVEEEPTPEDTQPEIMALTDAVEYVDGFEMSLSDYKRGTSSEYSAPENTPYASFTVKVNNASDAVVDLNSGYISCFYGEESREGELIFSSDPELGGLPSMQLRPGRSASARVACQLPKGEEYLQIELAPYSDAEPAIFAGNVK
ncbi:hypothetical protein [Streptomyces viridochromogenes]|uniref:hypothetical protein n=1 Tax=Streptomyces viridochromogenes TaxID=1938 RepID=UPI0006C1DAC6|nr:hypothetical protein [Streptomyces viridochromogenes]KOG21789.1 hypothetical protein ADK36_12490 [Streptomyces viridochromogenes]